MHIDRVSFGSLVMDGRKYGSDLLIFPDGRIEEGWRRARGHRLAVEDVERLLEAGPEVIVAGTGVFGRMKAEPDLEERLLQAGIRFLAAPNKRAMALFNEEARQGRVGGCFHLTC